MRGRGMRAAERRSKFDLALATAVLATLPLASAQQPQQRDLSVKEASKPGSTPKSVTPPRSYAVVIGIAKYQNLTPQQNLHFSERDAESIYSILISPEGG